MEWGVSKVGVGGIRSRSGGYTDQEWEEYRLGVGREMCDKDFNPSIIQ